MFYPSPWKGGWWRLGDAVQHHAGGVDGGARYGGEESRGTAVHRYEAGRQTIEQFRHDPPYAYVIPHEQRDLPTAETLVEKLITDGIEVHQRVR